MHSNYVLRNECARLFSVLETLKDEKEEDRLLLLSTKKIVDEALLKIAMRIEDHDVLQINVDNFTFDCQNKVNRNFDLILKEHDFEKMTLLNPKINGYYRIIIHAHKTTAPHRYISEKLKSTDADVITRSNFKKIYVQNNRTYLMKIHFIKHGKNLIQCIKLDDDYVSNGSLSKNHLIC